MASAEKEGEDDVKWSKDGEDDAKALKKRQLRREVQCACHLRQKLDRMVYGRDQAGFEEQMHLEAHELASSQFGPELLMALGEVYELKASRCLANELARAGRYSLSTTINTVTDCKRSWAHGVDFAKNIAESLMEVRTLYKTATEEEALH